MTRALCALAAVATLAGGCASRGAVSELDAEVGKLRSELSELRLAQEVAARDLARVAPQIQALEARTSETQATMRTLTDDIVRLARRYEGVDTILAEARARVEALTPAAAPPAVVAQAPPPAASAIERPRVAPPPAPLVPQSMTPSPSAPPAPLPPPAPIPPPAQVAPPAAPAPAVPRTASPAEQEYNAALTTFRSREHGQAVLDFIDFIAKYPKHSLAGNAQYWIGEAYWAQRDYRQALVEFEKVSEYGPAKAPDALVKVGLCHLRLRDVSRAQQAWQRVLREYPKSEAAILAQSLLRTHAVVRQ